MNARVTQKQLQITAGGMSDAVAATKSGADMEMSALASGSALIASPAAAGKDGPRHEQTKAGITGAANGS